MKILIIRFSSIGDIVLTSPVVRCIKRQVQNVEIHYLTKKAFGSLMLSNPYVDKVHLFDDNLKELTSELKNEKFDLIIDLHHNLRSLIVKKKLSVKSYSFYKANFEKWLKVNLKTDRLPKKHIVNRYMETAESLSIHYDGKGLDYLIPEKDEIDLKIQFPNLLSNGFVALVIGAKYGTKKLPFGRLKILCEMINRPIAIIGGQEDSLVGIELEKIDHTRIVNFSGKLSLNQSASILRQSKVVISHDTGMMHIAAALDKKILSVWGNTIPEFGMYPFYKEHSKNRVEVFQVNGLSCRPCSKIGYISCPKGHFRCMNELDLSLIVAQTI